MDTRHPQHALAHDAVARERAEAVARRVRLRDEATANAMAAVAAQPEIRQTRRARERREKAS